MFLTFSFLFWIPKNTLCKLSKWTGMGGNTWVRKNEFVFPNMSVNIFHLFISRVKLAGDSQSWFCIRPQFYKGVSENISWKFAAYGKFSGTLCFWLVLFFVNLFLVLDLLFIPGPSWTNGIYFQHIINVLLPSRIWMECWAWEEFFILVSFVQNVHWFGLVLFKNCFIPFICYFS